MKIMLFLFDDQSINVIEQCLIFFQALERERNASSARSNLLTLQVTELQDQQVFLVTFLKLDRLTTAFFLQL